jgi:hypothetical protein
LSPHLVVPAPAFEDQLVSVARILTDRSSRPDDCYPLVNGAISKAARAWTNTAVSTWSDARLTQTKPRGPCTVTLQLLVACSKDAWSPIALPANSYTPTSPPRPETAGTDSLRAMERTSQHFLRRLGSFLGLMPKRRLDVCHLGFVPSLPMLDRWLACAALGDETRRSDQSVSQSGSKPR